MQKAACPATTGDTWDTGAFNNAALKLDDGTTAWTSWWCSNGLYKRVVSSGVMAINAQ
jgi:hypothetical protein